MHKSEKSEKSGKSDEVMEKQIKTPRGLSCQVLIGETWLNHEMKAMLQYFALKNKCNKIFMCDDVIYLEVTGVTLGIQ